MLTSNTVMVLQIAIYDDHRQRHMGQGLTQLGCGDS